jgi:hypothetical protein
MRSGAYCKCLSCGYTGHVYGTLIGDKISHPWCPKCGLNNKLQERRNEHSKRD